jgi:hypothetical protein
MQKVHRMSQAISTIFFRILCFVKSFWHLHFQASNKRASLLHNK